MNIIFLYNTVMDKILALLNKKKLQDINQDFILKLSKKYDLTTINNAIDKHFLQLTTDLKMVRWRQQYEKLTKTIQFEQRTPIWYRVRKNMITATNVGPIVGACKYNSRKDILKKKVFDNSTFISNAATEHGKCFEDIAIQMYEKRTGERVHEFGLLKHPEIPFLGASPDGISENGIMVEIKCPYSRPVTGIIPQLKTLGYFHQMQTQMEVCDLDVCDFVECEIGVYDSQEDFENDGTCDFYTQDNFEKGVVGVSQHNTTEELKYYYPPVHYTFKEKMDFIEEEQKKDCEEYNTDMLPVFWYLKKYSCVRVNRDKVLFNNIKPVLYKFWEEVVELRKDNDLYYERYEKKKPSSRSSSKNSSYNQLPKGTRATFSMDDFD